MKNVEIVTSSACPHCVRAKRYLNSYGITYEEIDANTVEGQVRLHHLGSHAIPTIVVNDEVIIGFDEDRLMKKLELSY